MLKKISREDLPPQCSRNGERSPERQFAFETVVEFLKTAQEGDVYEVTGYPERKGEEPIKQLDRIAQALRTELWHMTKQRDVKVFRRRGRLFMEGEEGYVDKKCQRREENRRLAESIA